MSDVPDAPTWLRRPRTTADGRPQRRTSRQMVTLHTRESLLERLGAARDAGYDINLSGLWQEALETALTSLGF